VLYVLIILLIFIFFINLMIIFIIILLIIVSPALECAKKENLGPNINSPYLESFPVISPDGNTLYFYRMHPDNTAGLLDGDIWYSTLQPDSSWAPAKNIGSPLNNKGINYVLSVTPDGNSLLLGNKYLQNGETVKGVSYSTKTEAGWSYPKEIKIREFYNIHKYFAEYSLSNDSRTMLIAAETPESHGDLDLYVSFMENDTTWSKPKNLGNIINTWGTEYSPFLAADGKTLYFASTGHEGYGSSDIFMSYRLDDSWLNWTKPMNLGPDINTDKVDANFRISAKGDYAYFASEDGSIGNKDIFRIKVPDIAKPKPVILVYGNVTDDLSGTPLLARVFYEILPGGSEAGAARTDPLNGSYRITLPVGYKYGFRAEAAGYVPISDYIDAIDFNEYQTLERNLKMVKIEDGNIIRMNNVFFDYDSYILKEESYPELDRTVEFLKRNLSIGLNIMGHTDDVGSDKYNLELSEKRALAVMDYLLNKGVNKDRIGHEGFGKTKPLIVGDTDEARRLNRRVEFRIIKK
jgi:outer membrane protein OmpA-like peptidoglycan-associated protein